MSAIRCRGIMKRVAVSYDPEQAEQLLNEAGWKMAEDGIRRQERRKSVHIIV